MEQVIFLLPLSCHLKIRYSEAKEGRYKWWSLYWLALGHVSVLSIGVIGGVVGFAATVLSECDA